MEIKQLFDTIDSMREEYLKFMVDVLEIESPTDCKPGVDAVGEYFAKKAKEQGFEVEISKQEVSGNAVCITMNGDVDAPAVCLSGHMDTVHPVGFFGNPAVKIEDGIIKAPGIADCKGGIVAAFMAMAALKKLDYAKRPVKLILQSDEENSSATSKKATTRFMAEKAKGAVCFLNTEPSRGNITVERKGILKYKITVNGQAAHASICYKKGVSAVAEACHKILELEKYKDGDGMTVNCGLIEGGTAVNTVPAQCTFSIDIRYNDEEMAKAAEAIVKSVTEKSYIEGTTGEYKLLSKRLAMPKCERNIDLFNKINAILEDCGFSAMPPEKSNGGSDAADITTYGIPVADSIGIKGLFSHTLNEQAPVEELYICAKRLAAITAFI